MANTDQETDADVDRVEPVRPIVMEHPRPLMHWIMQRSSFVWKVRSCWQAARCRDEVYFATRQTEVGGPVQLVVSYNRQDPAVVAETLVRMSHVIEDYTAPEEGTVSPVESHDPEVSYNGQDPAPEEDQ